MVGVNSFLGKNTEEVVANVFRSSISEKNEQVTQTLQLNKKFKTLKNGLLKDIQKSIINNDNIFSSLMEACKHCSLEDITNTLYDVGGHYRRNM